MPALDEQSTATVQKCCIPAGITWRDYWTIILDKWRDQRRRRFMNKDADARPTYEIKPVWEKMVGWYDIRQLFHTGMEVIVSTRLARHADRRILEAVATQKIGRYYDYRFKYFYDQDESGKYKVDKSHPEQSELWIDYVSDTGDGWDSTYAVAHFLAQEKLTVNVDGKDNDLPRGNVLILGGDEVYPCANQQEYENRLLKPFMYALPVVPYHQHPHLFALPGNHDWYDSLANFSTIFCQNEFFPFQAEASETGLPKGGWRAPQDRSYFALRLPHRWWLIGIDTQLDSDIDDYQIEYLRHVSAKMRQGDRIILCCAEPFWIYGEIYGGADFNPKYRNSRLFCRYLEEKIFTAQKVSVYVAGDLHHYYCVQSADEEVVKITAGGGGAFLHPTHGQLASGQAFHNNLYKEPIRFPDEKDSRKLTRLNFLFPFLNWTFGFLTAFVYWFASWSVLPDMHLYERPVMPVAEGWFPGAYFWLMGFERTVHAGLQSPTAFIWAVIIVGCFYLFTDTDSKSYRRWGGALHGSVHVIACFAINWYAYYFSVLWLRQQQWYQLFLQKIGNAGEFGSWPQWLVATSLILGLSYFVGAVIQGVYLWFSLNWKARHTNEAFSSLAIKDWKNFLRMHIGKDGKLTIYPLGLRRVPRDWDIETIRVGGETAMTWVPAASENSKPELIQAPIHISGPPKPNVNKPVYVRPDVVKASGKTLKI